MFCRESLFVENVSRCCFSRAQKPYVAACSGLNAMVEQTPVPSRKPDTGQTCGKKRKALFAKKTSPFVKASAYQKGVENLQYNSKFAGQIIGKLRTDRELSLEMLSRLAGIARSHLAMIETGTKNANVDTLWRIAAALDIRLSELIRLTEEEHDKSASKS